MSRNSLQKINIRAIAMALINARRPQGASPGGGSSQSNLSNRTHPYEQNSRIAPHTYLICSSVNSGYIGNERISFANLSVTGKSPSLYPK